MKPEAFHFSKAAERYVNHATSRLLNKRFQIERQKKMPTVHFDVKGWVHVRIWLKIFLTCPNALLFTHMGQLQPPVLLWFKFKWFHSEQTKRQKAFEQLTKLLLCLILQPLSELVDFASVKPPLIALDYLTEQLIYLKGHFREGKSDY